jgi:glyoxylase-like metal-dependent hydrolase (beta-lactamase superfamily II)
MLPAVARHVSDTGVRIYRIACQAFPDLVANVYLLLGAGVPTLVDTGSGIGACNSQILGGIDSVRGEFGEAVTISDIRRVIITHGHIDHFGGLAHFVDAVAPQVVVHRLDLGILTCYEERVTLATRALRRFLEQAGVATEVAEGFLKVYGLSKQHTRSVQVDTVLDDGAEIDGLRFIHTPGHCPGQVCIAVGNILLTADHILPTITPHQAPESITPFTGLAHYLASLDKIRALPSFELGLGGHEGPIQNVRERIVETRNSHLRKLDRMHDMIAQADGPRTVNDISQQMYARVRGFHVLLAIEEVGAHIEYLHQHGRLAVDNLDEIESNLTAPLRYRAV